MGSSSQLQGRRFAALLGSALLISILDAVILGATFVPAEQPATSLQEGLARLEEAAAARPLALGAWIGAPALIVVCLAPLLLRVAAPRREVSPSPAPEAAAPPLQPATADPTEALRFLAILQREGRLIDFLQEDITPYDDAQIGAAVREIQAGCRAALGERMELGPVLAGEEGSSVEVEAGFDPARIRVTGNVSGDPPFRGVLRHGGWRVVKLDWPSSPTAIPGGRDPSILAPAEVEIP